MDRYLITALENLKAEIHKAALRWKADYILHIEADIISNPQKVVLMIYYSIDQKEWWEDVIEMPFCSNQRFEATYANIKFHTDSIRERLVNNAPDELDWHAAELRVKKELEEAMKVYDDVKCDTENLLDKIENLENSGTSGTSGTIPH